MENIQTKGSPEDLFLFCYHLSTCPVTKSDFTNYNKILHFYHIHKTYYNGGLMLVKSIQFGRTRINTCALKIYRIKIYNCDDV